LAARNYPQIFGVALSVTTEVCEMTLHPEDYRYWLGWLLAGIMARWFLVEPIIRALKRRDK